MKKLLLMFSALVLFTTACKKQYQQPFKKQIQFEELSSLIGKENALMVFESKGLIEVDPLGRGGKPKAEAVVVVWFNTLVFDGTTVSNMPADWKWAGVQNLTTHESLCNWYGAGTSGVTSMSCSIAPTSPGEKRGWCTDMEDNVYVSNRRTT